MKPGVPGRALRPVFSVGLPVRPVLGRGACATSICPTVKENLGQLGAEVGRDGSPQPAGELFSTSRKDHASPSLWSCVRQPRRRQRSIKNGNMVVTISCPPPFVSLASAHESPINLLHARIRLLDLQPRPPRPGLAGCSWLYSFRLGGSRKIAAQNRLLKVPLGNFFELWPTRSERSTSDGAFLLLTAAVPLGTVPEYIRLWYPRAWLLDFFFFFSSACGAGIWGPTPSFPRMEFDRRRIGILATAQTKYKR